MKCRKKSAELRQPGCLHSGQRPDLPHGEGASRPPRDPGDDLEGFRSFGGNLVNTDYEKLEVTSSKTCGFPAPAPGSLGLGWVAIIERPRSGSGAAVGIEGRRSGSGVRADI